MDDLTELLCHVDDFCLLTDGKGYLSTPLSAPSPEITPDRLPDVKRHGLPLRLAQRLKRC